MKRGGNPTRLREPLTECGNGGGVAGEDQSLTYQEGLCDIEHGVVCPRCGETVKAVGFEKAGPT